MDGSSLEPSSEAMPPQAGPSENTQIPTSQSEEECSNRDGKIFVNVGQTDEQAGAFMVGSGRGPESNNERPGSPVAPPPGVPPVAPPPRVSSGVPPSLRTTTKRALSELQQKHDEYILLLADRITELENSLAVFIPKPDVKPSPPPARTYVPKIVELFWNDYEDLMGYSEINGLPAIEVLVDMPSPRGRNLNYISTPYQLSTDADLQGASQRYNLIGNQSSAEPLGNLVDLPWRMRINTFELTALLNRIFEKGIYAMHSPNAYRRPFKVFVYYEKAILETVAGLRKTLDRETIESIENKLKESSEPENPLTVEYTGDNIESKYPLHDIIAKFITTYLQPVRARVPKQTRVQFHELWFLFEPGQYVFVREKGCPQNIWRVLQTTGGNPYLQKKRSVQGQDSPQHPPAPPLQKRIRTHKNPRSLKDSPETPNRYLSIHGYSPFLIDCYYIDFDGFRFRPVYRRFQIPSFEGNLAVSSLTVMPLAAAEEAGKINRNVRQKIGEQYLDCTKPSHQHFEGRTLDRNSIGNTLYLHTSDEWRSERRVIQESLEGKVMVDLTTAAEAHPEWQPSYDEPESYKTPEEELKSYEYFNEEIIDDYIIDQRRRDDFVEKEFVKFTSWNAETEKKPEGQDLLLLPDRVFAFVFRTRKWACLPLGLNQKGEPLLKKVIPEDDAWNDLQLPGGDDGHKHIIQSLIKKHFAKDMAIDLVRDKGRGLIILLHGIPGVGKTSTAECVAAANGKPLLPITCGDLGLSPKEVEENLEFHFQLAQAWDCVLLLDEADVFLARRTVEDVSRNALVSVFLRILEYYEGILFLTTNRVGTLDEGFRSRIHMSLYYPSLNEDQTKAIWKTLCRRAKSQQERLEIDEDEVLDYALQHFDDLKKAGKGRSGGWNGRQIKNSFMSAIALANYNVPEGHPVRLGTSHFKKVAKASKEFDDYMMRTHAGRDTSSWAFVNQIRADDFPVNPMDGDPNVPIHFGVPPRQLFRPTQPVQQSNSFGLQMPFMQAMPQHGFPQQIGMGMPPQQFYGTQIPQQQFYQSPQQGQMGQVQTGVPQQMGTQQASMQQGMPAQSQGQAQTGVQTQIPQQQVQPQPGQQGFVPNYGQGGFMGQQG